MTLYRAPAQEHLSLAKHMTAEVKTEEFISGKGVVTKWERIRKQNHWFDALCNRCVAGYGCGVRLVDEVLPEAPQRVHVQPERTAGAWPFTDHETRDRWNVNPLAYRGRS